MKTLFMNLSLFADAGTLVNATTQYVNAYTGSGTSFSPPDTLTPTMKTFYDTELLENHRDQLIFAQLGRKQGLPARRGRTIEWRKWNTLPLCTELTEAVIPTGQKMGMTSISVSLAQYGQYVTVSDLLQLHALRRLSAFTVNLAYNLEPVYSIVFAAILFGELREVNWSFWLGIALIITSVAIQSLRVRKRS